MFRWMEKREKRPPEGPNWILIIDGIVNCVWFHVNIIVQHVRGEKKDRKIIDFDSEKMEKICN